MVANLSSDDRLKNSSQPDLSIRIVFLYLFYAFLIVLSIVTPLVLWRLKLLHQAPYVNFTRLEGLPFELFDGLIAFVFILITWIEVKRRKINNLTNLFPVVLGLLVTLEYSFNIAESTFGWRINSDYIAFENGAKAILSGISPYINDTNPYVYPPLVGQIMAFSHEIVNQIPFLSDKGNDRGWEIVFYIFQCFQLLLITLAYSLTYKLAKKIGLKSIPAALIAAALFLFNVSVTRTLNFHQTNLWILNCFLVGILFQKRYPFLSGFAAALGVHIKMYPFILMMPWAALRKWRLLIGSAAGLIGIAILQTNLGRDWTLLRYFFDYLKVVSKPTPYRNNSVNSLVYNFFKVPNTLFSTPFDIVPAIVSVITLVIAIWFLFRFVRREKIYRNSTSGLSFEGQSYWNEVFRMYGHSMDAVALGLLISPSVYEHHYIVLIPVALWAITIRRLDKPIAVGLAIFLIFCIPTFDLFPLSFHRLIGLLMLVHLTNPGSAAKYFTSQQKRRLITLKA